MLPDGCITINIQKDVDSEEYRKYLSEHNKSCTLVHAAIMSACPYKLHMRILRCVKFCVCSFTIYQL